MMFPSIDVTTTVSGFTLVGSQAFGGSGGSVNWIQSPLTRAPETCIPYPQSPTLSNHVRNRSGAEGNVMSSPKPRLS
jgi:hypothetical protein